MSLSLDDIINKNKRTPLGLFNNNGFKTVEVCICDDCKGWGVNVITEDMGHSKGLEERLEICKTCDGEGRLEVEIFIKKKPFKPKKDA